MRSFIFFVLFIASQYQHTKTDDYKIYSLLIDEVQKVGNLDIVIVADTTSSFNEWHLNFQKPVEDYPINTGLKAILKKKSWVSFLKTINNDSFKEVLLDKKVLPTKTSYMKSTHIDYYKDVFRAPDQKKYRNTRYIIVTFSEVEKSVDKRKALCFLKTFYNEDNGGVYLYFFEKDKKGNWNIIGATDIAVS